MNSFLVEKEVSCFSNSEFFVGKLTLLDVKSKFWISIIYSPKNRHELKLNKLFLNSQDVSGKTSKQNRKV